MERRYDMSLTSLKWAAIICFIVAMAILLGGGIAMKKELPPYPGKVVGPGGNLLFEKADIIAGQGTVGLEIAEQTVARIKAGI